MNTHLNLDTEHDRKLAGTLMSLSLAPVPDDSKPPKPRLRRLMLPLGLVALAAALGLVLIQPETARRLPMPFAASPEPAEAVSVSANTTAPAGEGKTEQSAIRDSAPAVAEITGSGFVVAPRMTTVFAKYEGRIAHVAVEAGDPVAAGQVLVTLDDAGTRFALEQAEAAKVTAELVLAARVIDLAQANTSLARTETLAARNAASRQMLEEAHTTTDRASNAVAQARQEVARAALSIRIAQERLAELTVRAPFAGTITRLDAHDGDIVLARVDSVRESQSLLTITDTARLVIDADVAETGIALLRPGLRGQAVLDGFPGQPFAVEVARLAPVAAAEKGTITLRLQLSDPPPGIRPNMAARIRISLNDTGDRTQ
ncbi:efflux RND transporter periplasmic adaptor subunit [Pararhizobium polonicum]|nr:efflux RND transporter periplasmic adaptor subunit [Pararhizobium polonicum]